MSECEKRWAHCKKNEVATAVVANSLDTVETLGELRSLVAAMNSFFGEIDQDPIIQSSRVSQGAIKEAHWNSARDQNWVLVDSRATHELKVWREYEFHRVGSVEGWISPFLVKFMSGARIRLQKLFQSVATSQNVL